ncbi:MAG: methyltransferase domain-containing protein, partial [Chitinophagaceae bacterium]
RSIVEIGAGANPLLPISFVEDQQLVYQLIDFSGEELAKAGPGYQIQVLDFQQPIGSPQQKFDLVIAQMTLEHIERPAVFYGNVKLLLQPGGHACLFFATVTNLPMMLNHLLPDGISHRLLMLVQPFRKNEKHGKFPAFYRWCYGPTRKNISRLQSTGLDIELYRGYFGHSYYRRLPILPWLEKKKTQMLLRFPNPNFCTYAQLVLRLPKTA